MKTGPPTMDCNVNDGDLYGMDFIEKPTKGARRWSVDGWKRRRLQPYIVQEVHPQNSAHSPPLQADRFSRQSGGRRPGFLTGRCEKP